VLGLQLTTLARTDLRLTPKGATITPEAIAAVLDERRAARADKDFARSDALRDDLAAQGSRRWTAIRWAGTGVWAEHGQVPCRQTRIRDLRVQTHKWIWFPVPSGLLNIKIK
jgi:hypothetical protein